MKTEHDLDRSEAEAPSSGFALTSLVSVSMLNTIALCTAVLWLVGSVGAVTSLARSNADPAMWEYIDAAASSGVYLIVTVLAMSAAALLDAVQHQR